MKLTALTLNPEHGNAKHEPVALDYHGVRVEQGEVRAMIRFEGEDGKLSILSFEDADDFRAFFEAVESLYRFVMLETA